MKQGKLITKHVWLQFATYLALLVVTVCAEQAPVQNLRLMQQQVIRLAFRWDPPISGPVDHYQIYLNGDFQETIDRTHWSNGRLLPDSGYTLTVRAVDAAGLASEAELISVNTLSIPPLASSFRWNTILVRYADFLDEPFTKEDVESWVYSDTGSVNAYFREVSYERTSITGTVSGWYTLPEAASYYHKREKKDGLWWGPDISKIRADLKTIAPKKYPEECRIVFLHGTGDAGWAAGAEKFISTRLRKDSIHPIIHEIGHGLSPFTDMVRLGHPGGWLCPDAPVGPSLLNPRTAGCQAYIYGSEPFDPMGSGTRHFMAYNKWLLGMIDENQIVVAEEGQEYELGALEVKGGVKMIRIPIDSEYFYCIEYRKPIGLDGKDLYSGSNIGRKGVPIDGVLVRVRMTGGSPYTTLLAYPPGNRFAPLVCNPGTPFEDPYRGFRVEVVSKSGDIARVKYSRISYIEPKIVSTKFKSVGNQFSYSWKSEKGATYLIERSTDLKDWVTLNRGETFAPYPENGAIGEVESYMDNSIGPNAFYRVRRR